MSEGIKDRTTQRNIKAMVRQTRAELFNVGTSRRALLKNTFVTKSGKVATNKLKFIEAESGALLMYVSNGKTADGVNLYSSFLVDEDNRKAMLTYLHQFDLDK